MLFVTSIIFFRKDLSMALGLSSSLLITYLLLNVFKDKAILIKSFFTLYFAFSIFYINGGMEFAHVDYQKSLIKKNFLKIEKFVTSKSPNNPLINDIEIKIYYFYKNYDLYEVELKEFAKNNSNDFLSFVTNFPNFKNYK